MLFSKNLTFDDHVFEYLIRRVEQELAKVKGLLKGIQIGRCTFLRVLWFSKIIPILEYGSSIWSSSISGKVDPLKKIDSLQGEFFRSSMGLPSGTSHDAIIVDLAVPKQSLRFSFCRKKLKARMDFEITPPIVNKQRDHYKSSFSDKFEIK